VEAKIYYLSYNGTPFYIGKTTGSLESRLCQHRSESLRDPQHPKSIIILRNKYYVQISEIETIIGDNDLILKTEEYWVFQFKAWGFNVVNYCVRPKKQNGNIIKMIFHIPPEVLKEYKLRAVAADKSPKEVMEDVLIEWVKSQKEVTIITLIT